MSTTRESDALNTYRYLRLATIVLLAMLLVSVVLQWWSAGHDCWLGSISAYYFTPVRSVFVGALCALGASLIIYKGQTDLEDVVLNFSGFMAFVVAMVPTVPDIRCGTNSNDLPLSVIASSVDNNIWSLVIAALLGAAARWVLGRRRATNTGLSVPALVATWVCLGIMLAELGLFVFAPTSFQRVSHGIAASTMILGIIFVMLLHARRTAARNSDTDQPQPHDYVNQYTVVAVVMLASLAATVIAHLTVHGFDHVILWLEVLIIVEFCWFWAIQTRELWGTGSTPEDRAVGRNEPVEPTRQQAPRPTDGITQVS